MLSEILEKTKFWWQHKLLWLKATGSTNDDLKAMWRDKEFCHCLEVADIQTKGKGQYDRKWLSSGSGQCLMFSFSLDVKDYGFPVSMMAGVALALSLERLGVNKKDFWLKWPNDIWAKDKKLAGILTESTCIEGGFRSVVGIGMNILPLSEKNVDSISLQELEVEVSREKSLSEFCNAWDEIFGLSDEKLAKLWNDYGGQFWEKEFWVDVPRETKYLAVPQMVDENGALTVRTAGISRRIISGTLLPRMSTSRQKPRVDTC